MKSDSRGTLLVILLIVLIGLSGSVKAETTLEKIARTGTVTIGTRTGSPPFGYVNKNNDWVGFSIELVESAIAPVLSKKVGKQIKIDKKESTPQTRIPLLTSNAVDLIAETMTDTQSRRESVDFSITYFVTGAQFLVKKGNAINGLKATAGKRIAAQQGSTNARIIRERVPTAKLVEFPDQPAAFQALAQGQVQEPYGMAMRKNESDFRHAVNVGLMDAIESGRYFEIYEKWLGQKGEVPYPLSAETKRFLQMQVVPK
jgi:polar amino acid transport system substrate-binding protein